LEKILSKNARIQRWHNHPAGFWIDVIVSKTLVTIFFGYCTLPFGLLKFERWWMVYKDLYFCGCFIFGLWPLYAPLVKAILNPRDPTVSSPSKSKSPVGESSSSSHSNGIKQD
jgi:hypothetical protein